MLVAGTTCSEVIGAIGEDAFDEEDRTARDSKQGHGAVAVLHGSRIDLHQKRAPVDVRHAVTLAVLDLLPRAKAARAAAFVVL